MLFLQEGGEEGMVQVEAGTSVTNRTGLGSGGTDLMLLPQPMKAGACYWQVDARCWLKLRWRG